MTQHTKGPWGIAQLGSGTFEIRGSVWPIAVIERGYEPGYVAHSNRALADARLIAAAPCLLAVLKELQQSAAYWSEYEVPLGIVDRINAAIKKAEGQE